MVQSKTVGRKLFFSNIKNSTLDILNIQFYHHLCTVQHRYFHHCSLTRTVTFDLWSLKSKEFTQVLKRN